MADALDSDSSEEIHAGSSPVIRTKMISGQKRSWGDALSKVSCGQFVAKARECPYGTREEAPWALPV